MPAGRRPFLDGDQLDGAGEVDLQLLVGRAPPLQPLRVDHEHVDVLPADGLLPWSRTDAAPQPRVLGISSAASTRTR
jgi:hypothetical protein